MVAFKRRGAVWGEASMNHLMTFANFLKRRFAKEHGKRIIIKESKRMKKMLGCCQHGIMSRSQRVPAWLRGKVVYEIRLNVDALEKYYSGEEVRQIIMHELIHTLEYNHGTRFRKICTHYGVDEKRQGPKE